MKAENIILGEIYGIPIIGDPTLPIGAWHLDDGRIQRIGAAINELRTAFQCELMDVVAITVKKDD